jgi:hypothetical protein
MDGITLELSGVRIASLATTKECADRLPAHCCLLATTDLHLLLNLRQLDFQN